ncbi:MAG: hypothetical protein Q9184_003025 [Pyrenodesmia sp. 2 TL-2023]
MQRRMLSKEDEAAVGNDELEVRREDQDKINKFSRLHQRETLLEEDLKSRAKEKEDLEEISNELELADEDEKIPYGEPYKLGDAFIMLPLPEVQELLAQGTSKIEKSVSETEAKLHSIREEMELLKVDLYARFGKSINLETYAPPSGPCQHQEIYAPREENGTHIEKDCGNRRTCDRKYNGSTDLEESRESTTTLRDTHTVHRPEDKSQDDGHRTCKSLSPSRSKHVQLDAADAEQRYKLEKADNPPPNESKPPRLVISFAREDPENPYNWSTGRKILVLFGGSVSVVNSTLGSSLPSGAIDYLAEYFHVTSQAQLVLPISLFLVGYVFGPVVFAPLSETYGRRVILVTTFVFYTIFTLACALAPSWPFFLIFRLLCGITASSAIAIVGGLFADIYSDPITRGRAMAFFMAVQATTCGPQLAPIISGFISGVTWRWTFWVGLIIAGLSLAFLFFIPETYGPTILKRRAEKMRKETSNPNIFAPIELEKKGARQMITITLTRPVRMILFEAIVLFTCLYVSIAYAIFYLFFEAYPLIFQDIYDFNTGTGGLPFLAIGVGAFLSVAIFMYWDSVLVRAKKTDASWTLVEENRRLPLACLGGPLYVISLFWLGWTANANIHWMVPILSGLPFGIGFMLIFMALLNYVTDAYEIFAASALAATSACRSIFGAVLPIAARPMYDSLGIAWASSLLAFLSLGMSIIPFAFIRYGDRIRANSKFCQELRERKREYEEEREREESVPSSPKQKTSPG